LPPSLSISKGTPLFPRIKLEATPGVEKGLSSPGQIKPNTGVQKAPISVEDFSKLDLRVGIIRSSEKIKSSKKLLVLQVDIGSEQRQVIAGIGTKYAAEDLIGKQVVVIANLKPATIMGVASQGMLLAAGGKEVLGLATFLEEIPPGSHVR